MDDEEMLWGFKRKKGGGIQRTRMPTCKSSPNEFDDGVASKDVKINTSGSLWARIFLPKPAASSTKKPTVLYFHGGGFCYLSVAHVWYHTFLHSLAKSSDVLVVAVEYRLAPENPLPAAYDDAFSALEWIASQTSRTASVQDPWLMEYADFSRCFIAGDSAGANIVHNLALRVSRGQGAHQIGHGKQGGYGDGDDSHKLQIVANIAIHPFFGGVIRTRTEEMMADDPFVALRAADWSWRHALPEGSDRDHRFCNPLSIPVSEYKELRLPKILVVVALGDPLIERQIAYYHRLQEAGVDVQLLSHDGSHGFQLLFPDSDESAAFIRDLSMYMRLGDCSKL